MVNVNLNNCAEVAKAELARLHDQQVLLQYLVKALLGKNKYDVIALTELKLEAKTKDDYLELPQ